MVNTFISGGDNLFSGGKFFKTKQRHSYNPLLEKLVDIMDMYKTTIFSKKH